MWNRDTTWGELRAFHEQMRTTGAQSPDDYLSNPKIWDLSLSKEDHEYVWDISEEQAAKLEAQRLEDDIEAEPGIVSVTVSDTGEILELIKVTEDEGRMYVREQRMWAEVLPEQDEPRIYDQNLQDVDEKFVEYWDRLKDKGAIITKDIVQHYAA